MIRTGTLTLVLLAMFGCDREEPVKVVAPDPLPIPVPPRPQLSDAESHAKMIAALRDVSARTKDEHYFIGDFNARKLKNHLDGIPETAEIENRWMTLGRLGIWEGWLGNFEKATKYLNEAHELLPRVERHAPKRILYEFFMGSAMVWMRLGETQNCVNRHTAESCIMPIQGKGVHVDQGGSRRAIEYFNQLIKRFPDRLAPRWMLNVAHMTIGEFPDKVPSNLRIPAATLESKEKFPRFTNVAPTIGLDTLGLCGSVILDDFNGDGFPDAVVSSWDPSVRMWFFRNNGDGTFTDESEKGGLKGLLGGLNLNQTDYNNDGHLDVYVLRGAWLDRMGRHPNSLLRNNGDGTFTDVTFQAGLGEAHYPTGAGR